MASRPLLSQSYHLISGKEGPSQVMLLSIFKKKESVARLLVSKFSKVIRLKKNQVYFYVPSTAHIYQSTKKYQILRK